MTTAKEIAVERWEDWCDAFTNGNLGRSLRIELVDEELGDETLAQGVPLVGIDYDTPKKGNDLVISYGDELAPTSHIIQAPVRLWQVQDTNGLVMSLEVEDESGRHTILSF